MIHFVPQARLPEAKGERSASRDSLLLLATIERTDAGADVVPIRVRTLSAVGLMADYQDVAKPGEPVIVNLRGPGKVAGRVAWVRRGQIGIAFDERVDPRSVRRRPIAAPQP